MYMSLRLHQAMNSLSLSPCNIPGTRYDVYNIEKINFLTSTILLLTSNERLNKVNTYYTKKMCLPTDKSTMILTHSIVGDNSVLHFW
jgi:hypothetical protein